MYDSGAVLPTNFKRKLLNDAAMSLRDDVIA